MPTGDVQKNLRLALRMMLKPLVKLLVNQGLTHSEFSDAAKDVYVEMAARHFMRNGNINQSRIAVLTGLTRKEVKRVLDRAVTSEGHGKEFSRPSKVLLGWHSDPRFLGPYGLPLELGYDNKDGDEKPSFVELVRTYGSDMAPRQMIEVLNSSGCVEETEPNVFKAIRRSFEPTALSPELIERFGDIAQNFFSTAAGNIEKKTQGGALLERVVAASRPLAPDELESLTEFIKQEGQPLLEKIDNWIVSLGPLTGSVEEARNTGLGMYHYIENPTDKESLTTFIEEMGVELEETKKSE